jgi:membrane protease YdiL (CAAX protease family)
MGGPLTSEPEETARRPAPVVNPWGPWSTVGLGVLTVALWIAAQMVGFVPVAGIRLLITGVKTSYSMDKGWIVARMTIVGAPVAIGATVLWVRLRKGGSALVVAAPLSEEFIFRGFLFPGL